MRPVRMVQRIGGVRNGVPWPEPGDVVELPDSEAADMISNGYAEQADAPQHAEALPDVAADQEAADEATTVEQGDEPASEPEASGTDSDPSPAANRKRPAKRTAKRR